ncbi:hypothetical protein Droror1_Dr00017579 [Drosera rotundifolia]
MQHDGFIGVLELGIMNAHGLVPMSVKDVVPWIMSKDVQLVMLRTGRDDLELILKHFESQYLGKTRG